MLRLKDNWLTVKRRIWLGCWNEIAIWKREVRRRWKQAVAMIWQPWTTCSSSSISSTDLSATLPRKLYWRSFWWEHCDKMRSWQCRWIIPLLARIRNFSFPPSSKNQANALSTYRVDALSTGWHTINRPHANAKGGGYQCPCWPTLAECWGHKARSWAQQAPRP